MAMAHSAIVAGESSAAPMLSLVNDASTSRIVKQGAEAKIYISTLFGRPSYTPIRSDDGEAIESRSSTSAQREVAALIKHRFPKTYRHPSLSTHLTATRTIAEARALLRCARSGVNTPRILCVDEGSGILALEVIDGHSVRELLGGGSEGDEVDDGLGDEVSADLQASAAEMPLLTEKDALNVMQLVGVQLARMHQAHIIHGDLTTSNMMLHQTARGPEVVLIDFGLSSNSTWAEDKAVDLYVLERAFSSTHPQSEHLFAQILDTYQDTLEKKPRAPSRQERREFQQKGQKASSKRQADSLATAGTEWVEIKRKLDDVRLRGRKRSMVG